MMEKPHQNCFSLVQGTEHAEHKLYHLATFMAPLKGSVEGENITQHSE